MRQALQASLWIHLTQLLRQSGGLPCFLATLWAEPGGEGGGGAVAKLVPQQLRNIPAHLWSTVTAVTPLAKISRAMPNRAALSHPPEKATAA